MGACVMFAVIQENRLLGTGDTPLEAWIVAYEALGRPLNFALQAMQMSVACEAGVVYQFELFSIYLLGASDLYDKI